MLNIKDLKVGDGLECVDKKGYIHQHGVIPDARLEISGMIELVVIGIESDYVKIANTKCVIPKSALCFFRLAESSQIENILGDSNDAAFHMLLECAYRAVLDKKINISFMSDIAIHFHSRNNPEHGEYMVHHDDCEEASMGAIKFIRSLYKETFVIESEDDIKRINSYPLDKEPSFDPDQSPKAILNNGNVIQVFRKDGGSDNVCVYMRSGLYTNYLDFEVLKGATVEQLTKENEK